MVNQQVVRYFLLQNLTAGIFGRSVTVSQLKSSGTGRDDQHLIATVERSEGGFWIFSISTSPHYRISKCLSLCRLWMKQVVRTVDWTRGFQFYAILPFGECDSSAPNFGAESVQLPG